MKSRTAVAAIALAAVAATPAYPGARPLYIYVKNAHAAAIPGIRQYVGEFTRETAWGRNGYLVRRGMIASPDQVRANYAKVARELAPVALASIK